MPTDETVPPIGDGDPTANSNDPIKWYLASVLGVYLIAMSITLSYMLYNLWPPQLHAGPKTEQASAGRKNKESSPPTNSNANSNIANVGNASTSNAGRANVNAAANRNTNTSGAETSSNGRGNSNTNKNAASPETGGPATSGGESVNQDPTQNDTKTAAEEILPTVTLFRGWLVLNHSVEVRLLLIALLAGALGSYIHAATSFADYVGNRKLSGNWVWWYLLRPFIGMTLALIFYFVVRGGFISPSAGGADMNPFGIAAMAGLVGMFSKQAIDKLNEVFISLFGSKGDDKRGDKLQGATITTIKPNIGPIAGKTLVQITGTGFLPNAGVTFGGKAASEIVVGGDGKTIAASTPAAAAAGPVTVEVVNANGQKATLPGGFTYQ
jgi:hypothetical protein